MSESELETFRRLLPDYYYHLKHNPESLLARIYGIFTVKMEDLVPVNIILMGNTIQYSEVSNIENVFDLKGSLINREVREANLKNTSTLKDLNFLKIS
jgi:1-phosphatidylinositol-4-phosphate 5-kinase